MHPYQLNPQQQSTDATGPHPYMFIPSDTCYQNYNQHSSHIPASNMALHKQEKIFLLHTNQENTPQGKSGQSSDIPSSSQHNSSLEQNKKKTIQSSLPYTLSSTTQQPTELSSSDQILDNQYNNNNADEMEDVNADDANNGGSNLHPIACTRCRERHKRCDRKLPQCTYCTKQGHTCIYKSPKKVRRVYQRAIPIPAGNDGVSSITMVTGHGSAGSFYTSTIPQAFLGRRGSVDSTMSSISTFSSASSTANTTNSSGDNSPQEQSTSTNAFEIFTFRWQGTPSSSPTGHISKKKTSNRKKRKQSLPNLDHQQQQLLNPNATATHNIDNSSPFRQANSQHNLESYVFGSNSNNNNAMGEYNYPKVETTPSQSNLSMNMTNNTSNPLNNANLLDSILTSAITNITNQKEISLEHLNLLAGGNSAGQTPITMDINQGNMYSMDQNITFKPATIDFFFKYISLGYSLVPKEVLDSFVFGMDSICTVFGSDVVALVYAIHAATCAVTNNQKEGELAFQKSEMMVPSSSDLQMMNISLYESNYTVARNIVLAHYQLFIGDLNSSRRYLRLADEVLVKKVPNYGNRSFINCAASGEDDENIGFVHENSIYRNLNMELLHVMKYRMLVGLRFEEVSYLLYQGIDYVHGNVQFSLVDNGGNYVSQPLQSINLLDSQLRFRTYIGMSMMSTYLYYTGTIPTEILSITTQPLTSENIKLYLTFSLLLRKKIKSHTKARTQTLIGDQASIIASPLSLLIDLYCLSCSMLILHETMTNQGLYNDASTDQVQYTSVMFQYADQMKDLLSKLPESIIHLSYFYLGTVYLLVMYFRQLETIEKQAFTNGLALASNEAFQKQLHSLAIVHRFISVMYSKHPTVLHGLGNIMERIERFMMKYQQPINTQL